MNVALVTRKDRLDRYWPHMWNSLCRYVLPPGGAWSAEIHVDDSNHVFGMAGAVAEAWRRLPTDTDYVVDVEEDFVFVQDMPVELMCRTLEANPQLAQLCLKRGPCTPEEVAAGGFVELARDEYRECAWFGEFGRATWLEHKRCFSLNPCVYPYSVVQAGMPDDASSGVEAALTASLRARKLRFGVWGSRGDDPQCVHIGFERAAGWRL